MRTSWIVTATAVLGCLIGFGLTYYEAVNVGDRFEASFIDDDPGGEVVQFAGTGKAIVVGESVFDFGTLEKDQTGKCTFTVRNEGVEPLMLALEGVSCGLCIQTEFSHADLAYGKEYKLEVNYTTQKDGPDFSEYVEMRTSDPKNTVIRFNITGYVTKMIRFSKSEIALGSISAGEDASAEFRVYGFSDDPIKIVDHEFSGIQSSEYFKLELDAAGTRRVQRRSPPCEVGCPGKAEHDAWQAIGAHQPDLERYGSTR